MADSETPLDLTLPIDDQLVLYPGDAVPKLHRLSSISDGAALTASSLEIGCHVGTHVDAPSHFLPDGASLDQLPLSHFHGPAHVFDMGDCKIINETTIRSLRPRPGTHILLKTRNSELLRKKSFDNNYYCLTPEATEVLLAWEPLSVGFDYYSLDPPSSDSFPSHLAVARRGLPVFVCLNLLQVEPGEYTFSAFPLKIPGLEASPVRAVLFPKECEST